MDKDAQLLKLYHDALRLHQIHNGRRIPDFDDPLW
jgi:hypothetical protein